MAMPRVRHSSAIPRPLTPLVGRTDEVEDLGNALLAPSSHALIVTLIGPGGVGKTRLALHVAATLEDRDAFPDGVVFVPLASLRDPSVLLPTIGQALGVADLESIGGTMRLLDHVRARRMLLVLDNVEQIIDATAEVASVLVQAPGMRLLVTSQLALGITGEQRFSLLPLPIPGTGQVERDALLATPSVALFVQRGQAVRRNLDLNARQVEAIAAICRDLEGLPLAIELAAARLNLFSPEVLLARLSDRFRILSSARQDVPDRLRTMRQAIAWSYDLLGPAEQWLLRRLSVFVGGIPLEAVEAIPSWRMPGNDDPLTALEHLVDRSFLRPIESAMGDQRYLMLETIRQFAQEVLAASAEEFASAHLGHVGFFVSLAAAAEDHLVASDQAMWMRRLDDDLGNIRVALAWSLDASDGIEALGIMRLTWRYWSVRQLVSEGRQWFSRAFATAPPASTPAYVMALIGAGLLADDQNDFEAVTHQFQRAHALAVEIGDTLGQVRASIGLGSAARNLADYPQAIRWYRTAEQLAQSAGSPRDRARALVNLGAVFYFQGNYDLVEDSWLIGKQVMQELGDLGMTAQLASNLSAVATERGDFDRAEALLNEALLIDQEIGDERLIAFVHANHGDLAIARGNDDAAIHHLSEARIRFQRDGDHLMIANMHMLMAFLMIRRGEFGESASLLRQARQALLRSGDRFLMIETIDVSAVLLARAGYPEDAAQLLGAAAHERQELDVERRPRLTEFVSGAVATLRKKLGPSRLTALQEEGASWTVEAALDRLDEILPLIGAITTATVLDAFIPNPGRHAPAPMKPEKASAMTAIQSLSEREIDVLRLVAVGLSSKEIGDRLFISPRTATTHVTHILGKLGVSNRASAVTIASRAGII